MSLADAVEAGGIDNRSDLSMTVLMSEKMAVVAPMPSASVTMAVRVKTGDRRIWRRA